MRRVIKIRYKVVYFTIFFFTVALSATLANAGEKVELEGTLKGIKCTHYKVDCVDSDRFIAMEPDFVLVVPSGDYYFLANLSRAVKIRHAYRAVVVHGELKGQELWVDKMDDLEAPNRRRTPASWDWSQQDEFWESR